MPRSTRRSRTQGTGQRKRPEPNIPHHLIRHGGPATLEPLEAGDVSVQESDLVAPADAPRVDRSFLSATSTPAPPPRAPVGSPRAATPARAPAAETPRRAATDYGYVIGELKRIFITALVVIVALIVITLLRR
ncbi:MAG: hypothetical protein ACYDCQ_10890 [Dehalococcoidia bacterium]